jgi:hypothetical protein
MSDTEIPLEPCPFCGWKPDWLKGDVEVSIYCPNEDCGLAHVTRTNYPDPIGNCWDEAISAWNRRSAVEGWRLVPVEPTPEMHEAGGKAHAWFNKTLDSNEIPRRAVWDTTYMAMVAAAPQGSTTTEAKGTGE